MPVAHRQLEERQIIQFKQTKFNTCIRFDNAQRLEPLISANRARIRSTEQVGPSRLSRYCITMHV